MTIRNVSHGFVDFVKRPAAGGSECGQRRQRLAVKQLSQQLNSAHRLILLRSYFKVRQNTRLVLVYISLMFLPTKRLPMRLVKTTFCSLLLSGIVSGVVGCGGTTDPAAGIEPEKMAPAAEKLCEDPEYAKQFGGGKK